MTVSQNLRSMQFFLVAALALSAATALAQQKQGDLLSNKDIKIMTVDVPGGSVTQPTAIAPSGEIAGYYTDMNGEVSGFVRKRDGTFTTFTVPNSLLTVVTGVNSSRETVGYYVTFNNGPFSTYLQLGFRRSPDGVITTIPIGDIGYVQGINNKGQVTGFYLSAEFVRDGFVQQADGTMTSFAAVSTGDKPGFLGTEAMAINESGEITGSYDDTSTFIEHGFIRYANGKTVSFDVGTGSTYPLAINSWGEIVGNNNISGFLRRRSGEIVNLGPNTFPVAISDRGEIAASCPNSVCLLERDGRSHEFTVPGSTGIWPTAMNVRGEIVGYYLDAAGNHHGFLLTSKRFDGDEWRP